MAYREFVKQMFPTLANTALSATEKIKEIAKMYQEQKSKSSAEPKAKELKVAKPKVAKPKLAKPKAQKPIKMHELNHSIGVMKMSHSLRNQLIEQGSLTHGGDLTLPMTTSNYWIYPVPAELKGIPQYLLQHPNQYSGSKAQIMLYDSFENFVQTDTYKSNQIDLKTITPPPKYAQGTSSSAWLDFVSFTYGKELRVIFMNGDLQGQGSVGLNGNFNSYYIDCRDIQAYVNLLQQIYKDRDTLQPVEASAIKRQARTASEADSRYNQTMETMKLGRKYQKDDDDAITFKAKQDSDAAAAAADAAAAAASQQDSGGDSSIWGTISSIGSTILSFL